MVLVQHTFIPEAVLHWQRFLSWYEIDLNLRLSKHSLVNVLFTLIFFQYTHLHVQNFAKWNSHCCKNSECNTNSELCYNVLHSQRWEKYWIKRFVRWKWKMQKSYWDKTEIEKFFWSYPISYCLQHASLKAGGKGQQIHVNSKHKSIKWRLTLVCLDLTTLT